jgi:hypothetical protein
MAGTKYLLAVSSYHLANSLLPKLLGNLTGKFGKAGEK